MFGQEVLIKDELTIFVYLAGLVAFIFWIGEFKLLKPVFRFFPPLIFCYFLPMVSTTLGIIPDNSKLYGWYSKTFLLPTLVLLLLSANIPAIIKLGPKAIAVMLCGSAGVILGAPVALFIFKSKLGEYSWQNLGALVASWTGGSANMFALKEGLGIPDKFFAPMPIVDTVVGYTWMGFVIALAGYQEIFARKYQIDLSILKELNRRVEQSVSSKIRPVTIRDLALMIGIAFVIGHTCRKLGEWSYIQLKPFWQANLPMILDVLSAYVMAVIIVTFVALILSLTPLNRLEEAGASRVGFYMLYLILTMYGSQANLMAIVRTPWYIAVGVTIILIHASFLYIATRLLKAPLFLFAVGSQANIGGPPTASIVAATYQSALAPVGLLLGVLGSIIGTYCGIVSATLCRFVISLN